MAGRARTKALAAELDRRIDQAFEGWEDTTPTHLDYVCLRVENGTTTKDIAAELSRSLGFEVTYAQMMNYLRKETVGRDSEAEIDSARARASHFLVDESKELVDAASPMTVQVASARAKQRNWMAERYNPQRFGQSKAVNVAISLSTLHLTALQAIPNRVTGGSQPLLGAGTAGPSEAVQVVEPSRVNET